LRRRAQALTTPRGLFLVTALLLCALPVTKDIRDPDFWWHLRTGQLIVDRRGLLGTDPFTYTASTHHWTMHEWLTEVLFAGLYHVGGLALIVVVLSVVTWLALLCIFRAAQLRRPHHLALGLGLVLATISGSPVWGPRAQMITFAFTCLVLYIVERHLRQGGRLIWALVPLFLVWSNLHSGFIIGAGFIVLILGAEYAGSRLGLPGTAPPDRVRTLLIALVACGAVVALNPNGLEIYLYPFQTQGSTAQQSLIQEWQSPDFHDASVWAFEFMMLSLAIMLVVNRRVAPRDLVLALTTVALSLQSERHIALFVAASTPLWIDQANLCGQRLLARRRRVRAAPTARPQRPPRYAWMLSVTVIGGLGLFVLTWLANAASTREDSLTYARDYPVCAARWLAASPSGLHIFDQYGEGGYLASRLSAHGDKVFIFGDAALMGDDLLTQYGAVEGVSPRWDRILRDSGTDLVLFDTGTSFSNMISLSQRWTEVYRDPRSVAFVPATDAGRALAARLAPVPRYVAGSTDTCAQLQSGGLST
jgi:hypothetical protein